MYGEQEENAGGCPACKYKNKSSAPRRVLGIFSFKGEGVRAIPDFYFWRKNMFVIKHPSGQYFHKDRQIILYENPEQAQIYLEAFAQYGLNRTVQEMEHPKRIPTDENWYFLSNLINFVFFLNNLGIYFDKNT